MNKIFIITGLSGSGKTFHLNQLKNDDIENQDRYINLDELTKYYNKHRYPKNKFVKYFIHTHSYSNLNPEDINWENDKYNIHNEFLSWLTTIDGTFYIEGIHFIKPYIDTNFIYNSTILIIDKSSIKCLFNRINRCFNNDVPFYNKIYNLFKYDLSLVHIKEISQFNKFKKQFKTREQ